MLLKSTYTTAAQKGVLLMVQGKGSKARNVWADTPMNLVVRCEALWCGDGDT
jgi:hypothetical protein